MKNGLKTISICLLMIFSLPVTGFADDDFTPSSEQDPLESINRPIFAFNQGFDKYFMTPVSEGYNAIMPKPARRAANNFFDNIAMISTTANDILQGELEQSILDAWRFFINTTFGIGGLIDVAQEFGLPPHYNDMGLTFAKWGSKNSTYIVIPFLGASTVRDGVGFVGDYFLSPYPYIPSNDVFDALLIYRYLTIKAQLVDANKFMNEVALDPYIFTRDAYYQYRNAKIGGNSTSKYLYLEENEVQDEKPGNGYIPETPADSGAELYTP